MKCPAVKLTAYYITDRHIKGNIPDERESDKLLCLLFQNTMFQITPSVIIPVETHKNAELVVTTTGCN